MTTPTVSGIRDALPAGGVAGQVQGPDFASAWYDWHHSRLVAAKAPLGQAALVLTRWLKPGAGSEVPGLPGHWDAVGDSIVWSGFGQAEVTLVHGDPAQDPLVLGPAGEAAARLGEIVVRPFARDGILAVRVYDPAAPGRVRLSDIAAYEPDEQWRIPAQFEAISEPLEIELADGVRTAAASVGTLTFEIAGVRQTLTVTGSGAALAVVFGDATNGIETYGFRFLSVEQPDALGNTWIDFNRAYLPPCAFSDQFVCPLPGAGNRLQAAIRAGERLVVLD